MDIGNAGALPSITSPIYITSPDFNLITYISRYEGQTKINRLLFIAENCASHQEEAYRLLITTLKQPGNVNTKLYATLASVCEALGAGFEYDQAWVDDSDSKSAQRQERLESELQSSKSKMIKESIRLSFSDLGDFYSDRGNLPDAFKAYLRTRDYCTTSRHSIEMGLNTIRVCLDMHDIKTARLNITRIEQTGVDDKTLYANFKTCQALILLHEENFKSAALSFISIGGGLLYPEVSCVFDIATYGYICALATFDRTQLRISLIEDIDFNTLSELVPSVRYLARDFCSGQYARVLSTLESLKPLLQIDIHMCHHVEMLYALITERCMLYYFTPYSSADMTLMSERLQMPLDVLEPLLVKMISNNKLPAIIDSESKTLRRQTNNEGQVLFDKMLDLGRSHTRDIKGIILRLSLMKYGFNVDIDNQGHGSSHGTRLQGIGDDDLDDKADNMDMDFEDQEVV